MAVNFGGQATEAPSIPSAVTPKEGVQDKSGQVVLEGITGLFEQASGILKKKKEDKATSIVAEFASKQLLIAEGLEQGTISSSAYARSLARKNLLEAINANPALAKELIAADGSLTSLPGGTGEVRDGTEEEKRIAARKSQLVTAGIMPADADDTEFQTYDEMARTAEEAERRHTERINTLDLQLKVNTLDKSERDRLVAEKQAETARYVQDMAPASHQMMKMKFEEILKDPELSEADRQVMIEEHYNQWLAETSGTLGELESQQSTYMLKPFEELRDLYVKRSTGELGDEEVKRQSGRILEYQKSLALADPHIARMAVASELFGESSLIAAITDGTSAQNNALLKFLAGNSPAAPGAEVAPTFVKLPEEKKALKSYLNTVTLGLNSTDAKVKTESQEHVKNILKGLEDYESLIRSDPTKAIEIVNWLGSASFIAARNANPELFQDIAGATDVLTRHYEDEVWGMVQREFINSDVVVEDLSKGAGSMGAGDIGLVPATKGIGVRTTSSGMEFYSISAEAEDEILDEVRRLNKELKPVINNTIHAFAHLDGRTDYGKVWEEGAAEFLGQKTTSDTVKRSQSTNSSGGDANDDLVLGSFQEELEKVESTGEAVGSVAEAGAGYTVVVLPDGTKEKRTGTRAWRNNNPGNIEYGPFAKSQGAVGSDGRFAVFESYEAGREAKKALLFESKSYRNKTIYGAISRYAPDFENDTSAYANAVASAIGVSTDTPVSDLSESQRNKMLDAMERVEGFRVGKTTVLE